MDAGCRAWLEIDLKAVVGNLRAVAERVAPCGLLAVLKGDAYGLGARAVASAAAESGVVARLGIATLEEAIELEDVPLPKQIISAVLPAEIPEAVRRGFILPVSDFETAGLISVEAERQHTAAECELKIDTGMGRLGIPVEQSVGSFTAIGELPGLNIVGMFSHLACAGIPGDAFTKGQITGLARLSAALREAGMAVPNLHCAATDAIINHRESYSPPFTMVRPGTSIYGSSFSYSPEFRLQPAVTFKGRLIAIRDLPAGHSVGYSRLCRLKRGGRIGIVSAGYCDGVKIPLTNRGYVLLGGRLCPIAGRVSMDYTTVMLDGVPEARVGDEAVFIGAQGDARITVEECARINGTTTQDILCSFAPRVKRIYLGGRS